MSQQDIRWIQRFHHFNQALAQLMEAVELSKKRALSKLERQGVIQSFEYTHELAWNVLKDFLESRGVQDLYGSRDVSREAFKSGLIKNGESWMNMIKSRNQTTHTYNESTAEEIFNLIVSSYFAEYVALKETFEKLKQQ